MKSFKLFCLPLLTILLLVGSVWGQCNVQDNFSGTTINTSIWNVVSGDWSQNDQLTGYWSISAAQTDQGNILLVDALQPTGDYTVEVDAIVGPLGEHRNYHKFELYHSPGNKYEIDYAADHPEAGSFFEVNYRQGGSIYQGLVWIQPLPYNNPTPGQTNHLKLVRTGNHFQCYLNDHLIYEFDETLFGGDVKIGLGCYGTETYDNFCLTTGGQPSQNSNLGLLVQNTSSLDAEEQAAYNFASTHGFSVTLIDPNAILSNPSILNNVCGFWADNGSIPSGYNQAGVTQPLLNAINSGKGILFTHYGGFIGQYLGLGTATTGSWCPVHADEGYFVEALQNHPIYNGIATWPSPNPPNKPEQLMFRVFTGCKTQGGINLTNAQTYENVQIVDVGWWCCLSYDPNLCQQYNVQCTGSRIVSKGYIEEKRVGQGVAVQGSAISAPFTLGTLGPAGVTMLVNALNYICAGGQPPTRQTVMRMEAIDPPNARIKTGGTIRFRATLKDANANPLPNKPVEISWSWENNILPTGSWQALNTDQNGQYPALFSEWTANWAAFETAKHVYIKASFQGDANYDPSEATLDVIVYPIEAVVSGRVVDSQQGEGIAGVTVTLTCYQTSPNYIQQTITNEDGDFSFAVPEAYYTLELQKESWVSPVNISPSSFSSAEVPTYFHEFYVDKDQYLARRYAPIFVYHPHERYRPISIETYVNYELTKLTNWMNDNDWLHYYIASVTQTTYGTIGNYSSVMPGQMYYLQVGDNRFYNPNEFIPLMTDNTTPLYTRITYEQNRRVVQYWTFYSYNDFLNRHQGDWELVEVIFKDNSVDEPEYVSCSAHEGTIRKFWSSSNSNEEISKWSGTDHPVIFVAVGSHAGYPTAGIHGQNLTMFLEGVKAREMAMNIIEVSGPLFGGLSVDAFAQAILIGGEKLVGAIQNPWFWVASYAASFINETPDTCATDFSCCVGPEWSSEFTNHYDLSFVDGSETWLRYVGKWGRRDPSMGHATPTAVQTGWVPPSFDIRIYTDGPSGPNMQGDKWNRPATWGIYGNLDWKLWIRGASPFTMRLFDENGYSSGYLDSIDINEINGVLALTNGYEPMLILQDNPNGEYVLKLVGKEKGIYHLSIDLINPTGDTSFHCHYEGAIDSGQILLVPYTCEKTDDGIVVSSIGTPALSSDSVGPIITGPVIADIQDCESHFQLSFSIVDSGLGVDRSSVLAYIDGDVQEAYYNGETKLLDVPVPCGIDNGRHTARIIASDIPGNLSTEEVTFYRGPYASLSGFVIADSVSGLLGVNVDIYDSAGTLWQSLVTDDSGYYHVDSIPNGNYTISVVTPLGYQADQETKEFTIHHVPVTVNFSLTKLAITPRPRSRAYWAHQLEKALQNKPDDYTKRDFSRFAGLINLHFNQNQINPVDFYTVTQPASQHDSLMVMKKILHMCNSDEEPFLKRFAKAQLMALMLNVVSGKISQTQVISADGRTVSQAITYCDMLVNDEIDCPQHGPGHGSPHCRYILVDFILTFANLGLTVPHNLIPEDVIQIAYRIHNQENLPERFTLEQNYPNPFNPICEIEYDLPTECYVTLSVYNILGQKVKVLVDENQSAGRKSVKWDSKDEQGQEVTSGVYFYRIQAGNFVQSKKMVLMK